MALTQRLVMAVPMATHSTVFDIIALSGEIILSVM